MATYSTYPFYRDTYKGQLDEDSYNRLAVLAKTQIDYYTMGRAANAPESMAEQLAYAECAVIDALNEFQSVESIGGVTGVTSANNDGYSVSFSESARTDQISKIVGILNLWLSYPVNLMTRTARVFNWQRPHWGYCHRRVHWW